MSDSSIPAQTGRPPSLGRGDAGSSFGQRQGYRTVPVQRAAIAEILFALLVFAVRRGRRRRPEGNSSGARAECQPGRKRRTLADSGSGEIADPFPENALQPGPLRGRDRHAVVFLVEGLELAFEDVVRVRSARRHADEARIGEGPVADGARWPGMFL